MIGSAHSVPYASGPRPARCRPVHVEHRPQRGRPPRAGPVPTPNSGDWTSRQVPATRASARFHQAERAVRGGSGAAAPVRRAEREAGTPTNRPAASAGTPARRGVVRGRNAIEPCTTPVGIASTTLSARYRGTSQPQRTPGLRPICRPPRATTGADSGREVMEWIAGDRQHRCREGGSDLAPTASTSRSGSRGCTPRASRCHDLRGGPRREPGEPGAAAVEAGGPQRDDGRDDRARSTPCCESACRAERSTLSCMIGSLVQLALRRKAISGSCLVIRRRASGDPSYRHPSSHDSTRRRIGPAARLRRS